MPDTSPLPWAAPWARAPSYRLTLKGAFLAQQAQRGRFPGAQAQVADIGLMGGPAKLDGKAVEGVRIFLGGTIGEGAALAAEFEKGIPCEESILLPKLRDLLVERYGATPKEAGVLAGAA